MPPEPQEQEEQLPAGAGAAPPPEEPAAEPPAEQEPEPEIEIDGQTFKTEAEALEFARARTRELRTQQEIAEAYSAGIKDALPAPAAPPAAAEAPENWEERFYANPKGTLQELREEIKREIRGELKGESAEEQQWREFTERHPDLDGLRDDVYVTLEKEQANIRALNATKGRQAAMDYLAAKTRTKFEDYMEKKKPTKQLTNAKGGTSTGGQTNVTPPKKEEKTLSFTEQMRMLKGQRRK